MLRSWRVQRQPEELADKFNRIPVYGRCHIEPDNLDGEKAEQQRGEAKPAEIDRADLGLPEFAHPIACTCQRNAAFVPGGEGHAHFGGMHQLNLGKYILITCHFFTPSLKTRLECCATIPTTRASRPHREVRQ